MCAGAALPLIKNGNILAGAAVAGFPFYGGFVLGGVNMINGVADKLRDKSLDKEALDFRFGPEAIQDMTTETHNLRLANTYKQALDKGYFMEENQWKNVHDKIANSPWDYGKLTYVNWEENKQALRLEIMYAGLNKIIPRILMHDKEKIYDIIKIVLGEDGKQFCDPDYNPCAGCCDCKEK